MVYNCLHAQMNGYCNGHTDSSGADTGFSIKGGGVMAKVVLPKSGPAYHICPPKMVLPCQKRSAIQIIVNYTRKVCLSFFLFLQLENNVSGLHM